MTVVPAGASALQTAGTAVTLTSPAEDVVAAGASTPEQIFASVDRGFWMVDSGAFGYNQTTGAYSYLAAERIEASTGLYL